MPYAIEKDIELITFNRNRGGHHPRRVDEVWISTKPAKYTAKPMAIAVNIAGNVCEAAAWKAGDTVMLGRVKGANIWVFVPSKRPDAFVLRAVAKAGTLRIGSGQLAKELHAFAQTYEFEAWADDCNVYFKPKKGESE